MATSRARTLQTISVYLIGVALILAGLNHFRVPDFYIGLMPPWLGLPARETVIVSGWIEIGLGVLILPQVSRRWAGIAIIAMLIAFVPAHIWFIQNGNCINDLCFSPIQGWIRLLVVQPLLILWVAWSTLFDGKR